VSRLPRRCSGAVIYMRFALNSQAAPDASAVQKGSEAKRRYAWNATSQYRMSAVLCILFVAKSSRPVRLRSSTCCPPVACRVVLLTVCV